MKTVAEIRRENVRAIVDRDGLAAAARRFGKPDRQINDMIAGRKAFGEKVARAMEEHYAPHLRPGWLDIPPATHSPDETIADPKAMTLGKPGKPLFCSTPPAPLPVHDVPVISAEQIMQGEFDSTRPFVWVASDEHMASGPMPTPAGYHVYIDPTVQHEAGDLVLVRINGRPPVLRQITEGGDAEYLVTASDKLPPIRYDPDTCDVIGVALTSYPQPLKRKPKRAGE